MFIKVRTYLAPNVKTEDFRIQVRDPLANYVYGCHVTPVMRGALNMHLSRKASFNDTLFIGMHQRKATVLCSRIVFWAVLSLDASNQTVFLYYIP